MHEQGGPGSQERDQMLEGPQPMFQVRNQAEEGKTLEGTHALP